jgi:hypothetical protein
MSVRSWPFADILGDAEAFEEYLKDLAGVLVFRLHARYVWLEVSAATASVRTQLAACVAGTSSSVDGCACTPERC